MGELDFTSVKADDDARIRLIARIHGRLPAEWGEGTPATREEIDGFTTDLRSALREGRAFVEIVESGDTTVAFLWAETLRAAPDVVNIISLWTAEERRRQGLARALKLRMEEWARRNGVARILTGVDPRNTAVVRMNEKLGYRTTLLRMEKALEDPGEAMA